MAAPVVVIGAIGGPFGVNGWMHVKSFTEPPDNILGYTPWRLRRGGEWRTVDAQAQAHRAGFVARVAGVADRDAAARLRGSRIGVSADALGATEADEYYWRDLIGLPVTTATGEKLGRVTSLLATPGHDVLVIEDDDRERLIPFVRDIVLDVERERRVIVDWQPDW